MRIYITILLSLIVQCLTAQHLAGVGYRKAILTYEDGSRETGYINIKKNVYETFFVSSSSKEHINFKAEGSKKAEKIPTRNIYTIEIEEKDHTKFLLYKVVVKNINDKTGEYRRREDVMFLNKYIDGPMEVYGYLLTLYERNMKVTTGSFISVIKMPGSNFGVATKGIRWINTVPNFKAISQLLKSCPEAKAYLDEHYTNIGWFKLNYVGKIQKEIRTVLREYNKEDEAADKEKYQSVSDVELEVQLRFYEEINEKYKEFCGDMI